MLTSSVDGCMLMESLHVLFLLIILVSLGWRRRPMNCQHVPRLLTCLDHVQLPVCQACRCMHFHFFLYGQGYTTGFLRLLPYHGPSATAKICLLVHVNVTLLIGSTSHCMCISFLCYL